MQRGNSPVLESHTRRTVLRFTCTSLSGGQLLKGVRLSSAFSLIASLFSSQVSIFQYRDLKLCFQFIFVFKSNRSTSTYVTY